MPGRFRLIPVPLTNDPFCEDGFCNDTGGPVPTAKLLMIGNPYYSLDIPDPTAIVYQPQSDIIGCQTVVYTDAGMLIMSGGRLSRSESPGDSTMLPYTELALYDLDGNCIRRLAYERPSSYIYYYSYEAPYMSVVTSDNKVLAAVLNETLRNLDFVVAEADGTGYTKIAFNIPDGGYYYYVQGMELNPLSGRIYMNTFAFDYTELFMLETNRSAGWSYKYSASSGSERPRGFGIASGSINGTEITFAVGCVQNIGEVPAVSFLMGVGAAGEVVNSWKYRNVTVYQNASIYISQVFYGVVQCSDGTIVVGGSGTIEALPIGEWDQTSAESGTLTRINPLTGDVIKSVGITFINNINYGNYNYFSHSVPAVDLDGTIYYVFGGIIDYYANGFILQFNANLEITGAIRIKAKFDNNVNVCGLTIAGNKLLIPGIIEDGAWGGPNIGVNPSKDGITIIIDKTAIGPYAVGQYGTVNAGFEILDMFDQVSTMLLTQVKESLVIDPLYVSFNSSTPDVNIVTSSKAPASVVLSKQ